MRTVEGQVIQWHKAHVRVSVHLLSLTVSYIKVRMNIISFVAQNKIEKFSDNPVLQLTFLLLWTSIYTHLNFIHNYVIKWIDSKMSKKFTYLLKYLLYCLLCSEISRMLIVKFFFLYNSVFILWYSLIVLMPILSAILTILNT